MSNADHASAADDVAAGEDEELTEGAHERQALRLSMLFAFLLAVLGITVGVITNSQIILFDGFYTFLGIGLSWLALRISRVIEAGPTSRYPFGREALSPLIIGVEGVALLATCAYATFNAVLTIVNGGSVPPAGWGDVYAAVAVIVPLFVAWLLRHWNEGSELVEAEATQWFAGGLLGIGMLAGFLGATAIRGTSFASASLYVDPVLVIVACALFIGPPVRMIRGTFIELVEGSPDLEIRTPVLDSIAAVREKFELTAPAIRLTKVGRKLYAEVDFIVSPEWRVRQSDEVRRALLARFEELEYDIWLTLEFAADPQALA